MLARWGIRLVSSLLGVVVGIAISDIALDDFSIHGAALVEATLLFWIIHLVVQFLALRIFVREPSVALAGLLALASTIISLIIVNLIVSDFSIDGAAAYVTATVIIWLTTALGDVIGTRMVRARRRDDRRD